MRERALAAGINLRYIDARTVGIALNETVSLSDLREIINVFGGKRTWQAEALKPPRTIQTTTILHLASNHRLHEPPGLQHAPFRDRDDALRPQPGAQGHRPRYVDDRARVVHHEAERASEMLPVTWEHFSRMHPFVPIDQAQGYAEIFRDLETALCEITGFAAVSLHPTRERRGVAGLMVIRAYHRARGGEHRDIVLIPASSHGTNPASAAMAGMRVVVVATAPNGNVDRAISGRRPPAS